MTDISALISSLEKATEGSRELSAEVFCAAHGHTFERWSELRDAGFIYRRASGGSVCSLGEDERPYTTSLDAIVALIERKLPVLADFYIAQHRGSARATIWLDDKPFDGVKPGRDRPLAACIALLHALQHQGGGNHG